MKDDALSWVVTEAHARKMIQAMRSNLNIRRQHIAAEEARVAEILEVLNAVKAKMYAEGWTEE